MKPYDTNTIQKAIALRLAENSVPQISRTLSVPVTTVARWTKGICKKNYHPLYKTAKIKHDYFSPTNLLKHPERFVLIGFIAADGCVSLKHSKTKNKQYPYLVFNLAEKDINVLHIINEEISESTRHISHLNKTNSNQLYFPSNQICSDLSCFGILPRKTENFSLPELTIENMRYFLRGYFYGDGCAYQDKNRKVYHIIATSSFGIQLREFLIKNNIIKHCVVSSLKRDRNYSQIVFAGKHAIAFEQYIFNDSKMILLPRKHKLDV